jgi:hypothetical protein
MKNSIKSNIDRYGNDVVLNILTDGNIDFDTGQSQQTVTSYEMKALVLQYATSELIEGVININDLKCTLQFPTKINKGDNVVIAGVKYVVINVFPLIRDNKIVKQSLQLRS